MIIRELAAIFSFKYDASKLKQASSALDNFAQKANMVMGALAGHYVVQSLHNFLSNTANALEHFGKSSANLGVTTKALQELKFAAEKSGIPFEKLEDSLKELMLRSVEAKSGTGDAAEGFLALGIAVKDSLGHIREPMGLLDEVADKIKSMPTESDKIWATDKLFGNQGFAMLKLLNEGSEGIKGLREEAQRLGIILDENAIKNAKNFNQALKAMKASSNGLTSNIASTVMPTLTKFFNFINSVSISFAQAKNKAEILRIALIALSIPMTAFLVKAAIGFAPILLSISAITAGFLSLAIIVDDFWIAFKGGDSIFKSLYQSALAFFEPVKEWFANLYNLIPDFFKNGFNGSANIKMSEHQALMPSRINNFSHAQQSNNQSINVAVNVKSDSPPQAIGSEVSKAIKKELERERANAYMGVTQYAP